MNTVDKNSKWPPLQWRQEEHCAHDKTRKNARTLKKKKKKRKQKEKEMKRRQKRKPEK